MIKTQQQTNDSIDGSYFLDAMQELEEVMEKISKGEKITW